MAWSGWFAYRLWPRRLDMHPIALIPVWDVVENCQTLRLPGRCLVAEIGLYDDELFAYLMLQYLRGAPTLRSVQVILTYRKANSRLVYPLQAFLESDLLVSVPILAKAQAVGLIENYDWRYVTEDTLRKYLYQSEMFVSAYNMTSRRRLEHLSRAELTRYITRFLRFKWITDPRIRRKIEPIPHPFTNAAANRLAEDIVAVAGFYNLPLEFFLGIGAMENNYMDVQGDLDRAIWKRRPSKGDVRFEAAGRASARSESCLWRLANYPGDAPLRACPLFKGRPRLFRVACVPPSPTAARP